jgi:type I restriction enzyme, S subunit
MDLIPEDDLELKAWELRSPGDIRSGVFFCDGDVLFAKITPCLENGKQAVARGIANGWGFATTEVFPLHPTGIEGDYLALYLKLPKVRSFLTGRMEGTTGRQRLPRPVIESLDIPLPPAEEQREIASALRAILQAKEATEKVISATREFKRSLMRHLFTYGPTPINQTESVSLQETEIGPLPRHWQVVRFNDVLLNGTQNGIYKPRSSYGSGIPIVDMVDIFRSDVLGIQVDRLSLTPTEIDKYGLRRATSCLRGVHSNHQDQESAN